MTSRLKRFCLTLAALAILAAVAQAQDYDSFQLPPLADSGDAGDTGTEGPGPIIPGVSGTPPTWTEQRTTTNRAGTVTNTHRRATPQDGSTYQREHEVTNPSGERIQSWERARNEEGYLYRRSQTFTAPDGTQLQQHQRTLSGTDPYNYTRQHQIQLRDGRTITHEQTRSWDGTTGTMERTFAGPNGQQRYSQRAWSPDEPASPTPVVTEPGPPPEAEPKTSKMWGWVEKLNPFRKGGPFRPSKPEAASPTHGSGFTIGSGRNRGVEHAPQGLTKKQPGEPSPSWRRPPWAGNPHASNSPNSPSRSSHGRQ